MRRPPMNRTFYEVKSVFNIPLSRTFATSESKKFFYLTNRIYKLYYQELKNQLNGVIYAEKEKIQNVVAGSRFYALPAGRCQTGIEQYHLET